jgi:hypothetical protein
LCLEEEMNNPIRTHLREIIGVASHIDGLVCEQGNALSADVAAILLAELSKIAQELGWLADDVEIRLPRPRRKRSR